MAKKEVQTDKFAGTGKFASAYGQAVASGIKGGVIGGVIGAIGGSLASLHPKVLGETTKFLTDNGHKSITPGMVRSTNAVAGTVAGLMAIGFISAIVGLFKGWRKGSQAKQQFETLKTENVALRGAAQSLKIENMRLHGEVEHTTRKFADLVESNRAQGSHADAALASKAEADNAERVH